MSWPAGARTRFWGLLLPICAVAAVIGSLIGQLLGLTVGLGVAAVVVSAPGLVLNWRHRQRQ
jgi:hypothetical protein